jgi:hypothetical protein
MSASTPLPPNVDLDARRSYRKGANGQLAMTLSPKPTATLNGKVLIALDQVKPFTSRESGFNNFPSTVVKLYRNKHEDTSPNCTSHAYFRC